MLGAVFYQIHLITKLNAFVNTKVIAIRWLKNFENIHVLLVKEIKHPYLKDLRLY